MENDSNSANLKGLIAELKESDLRTIERLKNLIKKNSDFEKEMENLNKSKYEIEARLRVLESEDIEKIKHEMYRMESVLQKFESRHDDRRQNWNTAINFMVQLAWVSMAAWMLTKLGLQPPL